MRKDLAEALKKKDLTIQKLQKISHDYKEHIIKLETQVRSLEKRIADLIAENESLKEKLRELQ